VTVQASNHDYFILPGPNCFDRSDENLPLLSKAIRTHPSNLSSETPIPPSHARNSVQQGHMSNTNSCRNRGEHWRATEKELPASSKTQLVYSSPALVTYLQLGILSRWTQPTMKSIEAINLCNSTHTFSDLASL